MGRELILVAQIGAAHGLKGDVKLVSFTEDRLAIAGYGPLETEGGLRLRIAQVRESRGSVIARFEGIDNRTAAEGLKGQKLYVARDQLPAPGEGRYYHADLIGLQVESAGRRLGRVARVANFGAGDLLEVASGQGFKTLLVPFTGAKVDLAEGVVRVELPEGFLEGE
jgi:16S rRNA processing protein RimM